ncbi:DUF1997 domain-containing protein [Spirulina major CS-329]|uniref:DUF1997 domain-containing protein n=1 Tax=Spirulina TaxID=1154 RepID=UPI00232B6703|nr:MULTISPECIES: DUF1997 domain-containing protein [Spirulina]MDB9495864.1 DUF1997 domain-containing protein [Spirulina subsalsa CS-330]MDB9504676.1 DUF1997 domain-containing protein [Spirulina major CS-329]
MQFPCADSSSVDAIPDPVALGENHSSTQSTDHGAAEQEQAAGEAVFAFRTQFRGNMDMYGEPERVENYLNAHEHWFKHCAQPMTAEPLGDNGYVLTVGHFGAFGYEVEPKMAVVLAPPADRTYTMYSIPVPDYTPPGYDVDYRAMMTIEGVNSTELDWPVNQAIASQVTKVEWGLTLNVRLRFPLFIEKLPRDLIQKTGDRLLTQIVRKISPRLTQTVQKDFHDRMGLPLPPKRSRRLIHITSETSATSETESPDP